MTLKKPLSGHLIELERVLKHLHFSDRAASHLDEESLTSSLQTSENEPRFLSYLMWTCWPQQKIPIQRWVTFVEVLWKIREALIPWGCESHFIGLLYPSFIQSSLCPKPLRQCFQKAKAFPFETWSPNTRNWGLPLFSISQGGSFTLQDLCWPHSKEARRQVFDLPCSNSYKISCWEKLLGENLNRSKSS